jgi:hypothetical protein
LWPNIFHIWPSVTLPVQTFRAFAALLRCFLLVDRLSGAHSSQACLNRAFRGAASADCIWAAKLPANHRYLAALAAAADDDDCGYDGAAAEGSCSTAAIKKELYARLCRPTPFDGGTKVISLFFSFL